MGFTCHSAWLPNLRCSRRYIHSMQEVMIQGDWLHVPGQCQATLVIPGCPMNETLLIIL